MAKYSITTLLTASVCLLSSPLAQADFFDEFMIDPDDGQLDASRYISQTPLGFLPVPSIITEPAVGTGLALMGLFFHDTDKNKQTEHTDHALLPKSISIIGAMKTENGTWGTGLGHIAFWQQDTLRYRGFAGYADINLDFYSLAGRELNKPIALNLHGPGILQQLTKRIPNSNFFAGVKQFYRGVDIALADPLLPDIDINGEQLSILDQQLSKKITTSGLGGVFEFDNRNNPLNPEKGFNYRAEYMLFDDSIGSDVEYQSAQIKGLNYWQLSPTTNFAFRYQYDGVYADDDTKLPVYVLPFIDLRGIAKSRYQGTDVLVTEVELIYKLNQRWRINGFTGLGKASYSFSDIGSADSQTTVGAGFRYLIAKRYGFTMGLDIAKGPEESAIYIQAGASW